MNHREEAEKAFIEALRLVVHSGSRMLPRALDPQDRTEPDPELEDVVRRFTWHLLEAASERDKGPIVDGRG